MIERMMLQHTYRCGCTQMRLTTDICIKEMYACILFSISIENSFFYHDRKLCICIYVYIYVYIGTCRVFYLNRKSIFLSRQKTVYIYIYRYMSCFLSQQKIYFSMSIENSFFYVNRKLCMYMYICICIYICICTYHFFYVDRKLNFLSAQKINASVT